jgi:hypothetical protein
MSIRKDWQRLTRPESRFRGQVTSINADGTSTVQTADNRIVRVRNQPGLNIPVGSFCIVSVNGRAGELPTILRSAPELPTSFFNNL